MKRIVVFCGSSSGNEGVYFDEAVALGKLLANKNIELVYGGARVGIMGAVADAVLGEGGKAIGVLPRFLQTKEVAHTGLSELILTDTMHERKMIMSKLSDGVIALPGGFGTLEEYFEMLTWGQLGLHQKPMGILNTAGYYDGLLELISSMVNKGFVKPHHQQMVLASTKATELLSRMENYVPPLVEKWLHKDDV